MPRRLTDDELPDDYDALLTLDELDWGESNPRNVTPSEETKTSIERHGFENPIIVWDDDGRYEVTDGWQRYQAASEAGIVHIPCKLFDTKLKAMKHGRLNSLGRPWTQYNTMTHYVEFYEELREKGFSHDRAVKEAALEGDKDKGHIERYITIFTLPRNVLELLREPENRSEKRLKQLERYSKGNVNLLTTDDKLASRAAHDLAEKAHHVSEDRVKTIACAVFSLKEGSQKKAIEMATVEHPRTEVSEIVRRVLSGSKKMDGRMRVNQPVVTTPEVEEFVSDYLTETRTDLSELLATLVEEFVEEKQREQRFENTTFDVMADGGEGGDEKS